jgi:hypothetical protein
MTDNHIEFLTELESHFSEVEYKYIDSFVQDVINDHHPHLPPWVNQLKFFMWVKESILDIVTYELVGTPECILDIMPIVGIPLTSYHANISDCCLPHAEYNVSIIKDIIDGIINHTSVKDGEL